MYRQLRTRIALGLLLFLAACGDFMFGAAKVAYLCEHEAGPRISFKAEDVEGYFVESLFYGPPYPEDWPEATKKKNLADFAETLRSDGYLWQEGKKCTYMPIERCMYYRYTVTSDGKSIAWTVIPGPTRYILVREGKTLFPYILQDHEVIRDINTGTVLARYIGFRHRGGWLFHDYEGYRHGCRSDFYALREMVLNVLRPIGAHDG